MSGKYALMIGNTEYNDPGLAKLTAPGRDTEDFARVLRDPEICAFDDVQVLMNEPEYIVRGRIDEFFDQKKPDDLLVLYFSGHGVRDELGALYLAVKNTMRTRLRSTAIKSDYIREAMDQSRSKRQVLVLDCCNSGAFEQGTKAATGVSIGTASAFEAGYGRIILTASDSTQFAWEGNKLIGETDNSLFTHYLVEGLEGNADLDGDGQITVDELYDYAFEKVKLATPKQTPSKFSSKQQGEIILRHSIRLEDIKSVPLPEPLLDSIENPYAEIRLAAVQQLAKLMNGKNIGLARSAKEALEKLAAKDDSRQVSRAAARALGIEHQTSQIIVQKETVTPQPPVVDPIEYSKSESNETASVPNPRALITIGWAIAGAISGMVYNTFGEMVGGAFGGAIGGLITSVVLRNLNTHPGQFRMGWITLAWTICGFLGWTIGEWEGGALAFGIAFLIGASVCMTLLLATRQVSSNWKSFIWIIVTWAIGAAIGWSLSKTIMIDQLALGYAISWSLGTAIGWVIPGFVMGRQLLENSKQN